MTTRAYIPAATSSSTIPMPSGSRSNCLTGGGFRMSNTLKSIKPARKVFHESGTAMSEMSWPATSSMTTKLGSFLADARAARVAAGIPTRVTTTARTIRIGVRRGYGRARARAAQRSMVAADAHVPGPGRMWPMPKNVAVSVAQPGARKGDAAIPGGTPTLRIGGIPVRVLFMM